MKSFKLLLISTLAITAITLSSCTDCIKCDDCDTISGASICQDDYETEDEYQIAIDLAESDNCVCE